MVEVFEEREPRKARLALRQGLEDVVLVVILKDFDLCVCVCTRVCTCPCTHRCLGVN